MLIRLLVSPVMAFAFAFPTLGYYTVQTYSSLAGATDSLASIAVRAVSFALVCLAFAVATGLRSAPPRQLFWGVLFIVIYFLRMLENVLVQDATIMPGNEVALLTMLVGGLVPSLALATLWRGCDANDAKTVLSAFAIAFAIGANLAIGQLSNLEDATRVAFEKVNPIVLAYVSSTFLLYYMLVAPSSRRIALEALLVSPLLLLIVARAQSRGMMLSTAACLSVYFLCLRGSRRWLMLLSIALVGGIAALTLDPIHLEVALRSLERIDTVNDMSTAMRVISFHGAWEQFLADPLIGRYVFEIITNYYPHNIYLESLMAVGIIGSIPFAFHLVLATVAAIGILRSRDFGWFWTMIALLYVRDAVGAAASGSIWSVSGLWVTSFMVIAAWYGSQPRRRAAAGGATRLHQS